MIVEPVKVHGKECAKIKVGKYLNFSDKGILSDILSKYRVLQEQYKSNYMQYVIDAPFKEVKHELQ